MIIGYIFVGICTIRTLLHATVAQHIIEKQATSPVESASWFYVTSPLVPHILMWVFFSLVVGFFIYEKKLSDLHRKKYIAFMGFVGLGFIITLCGLGLGLVYMYTSGNTMLSR